MSRPKSIAPDDECISRGAKYACAIDYGDRSRSGRIYDEQGLRWRYGVRKNPAGKVRGNPFNKPDFYFERADGRPGPVIRRRSFIPSRFDIMEDNDLVGRIGLRSILRNKYNIEIDGVGSWIFRMPLFTIRFRGDSATATDIWVIVGPGKMQWNILLRPSLDDPRLLASLAFIHNEWWNYS